MEDHSAHKMTMAHDHVNREEGKPTFSRHAGHSIADFRRRFWICLLITVPILILSPVIQSFLGLGNTLRFSGDKYVLFALSSVVYMYGGKPFLIGLVNEIKARLPGMMTLVGIAITVAYAYSAIVVLGLKGEIFFWELATLIDVMLLGHWIEMKSVLGASKALEELARLMPSVAHKVESDGSMRDVQLDELIPGDHVLVKPGEKVPADGKVIDGETSVNESMLTGESVPVNKQPGANVIGGAVNGEGAITIEINKTGADSFLSRVIALVRQAQDSKSKTQDLANKAAMWLTIIAIGSGAFTLLSWLILIHKDFSFAIERAVTVMVIACPHALGLAVPLVVAVSTALSSSKGLLIRDRAAMESARNIQAVVFDKTGTLTEGRFGVTDTVVIADDIDENELLKLAASIESFSEHPIAKGITASQSAIETVNDFKALPGKGAQGLIGSRLVQIVSPGFIKEHDIRISDKRIEDIASQGKTVVYVLIDGAAKGAIALADVIRPESAGAIALLKEKGIQCMMLTGDNRFVAKWVADQLGLDDYFAEVLPEEKAEIVKDIQSRGLTVAMTGDGVNDAPALAQADVGIAVGAGTDIAAETADIILVRNNPLDIVAIIDLAKATYRKMVQNLVWATGYNVLAIPLAAGVLYGYGILLSPALGAALMSLSTVVVAVNARLLKT